MTSTHMIYAIQKLSEAMKHERLARRLSRKDVAEKINVTMPTIDQVEKGNLNVRLGTYLDCIELYGMSDSFFQALVELSKDENETEILGNDD